MAGSGFGRKKTASYGSLAEREETTGKSPVKAHLEFATEVDAAQRIAAEKARDGVGAVFPANYNRLKIWTTDKANKYGFTKLSASEPGRALAVGFNPKNHESKEENESIGKLAETFTHEFYVHARTDMNLMSQGLDRLSASVEHGQMFEKGNRQGFLNASRRTFDQLANAAQKRAFANEWHKDMTDRIGQSAGRKDARDWATKRRDSMIDAIDNRRMHIWD